VALDWHEAADRDSIETLLAGIDPTRPPPRLGPDTLSEGPKNRLSTSDSEDEEVE
jgi:hypothetical protein